MLSERTHIKTHAPLGHNHAPKLPALQARVEPQAPKHAQFGAHSDRHCPETMSAPRPSSLPILAQCSAFESTSTDFAELGTDRHAALHAYFNEDKALYDLLDEESQLAIQWAAEYIRLKAPLSDYPIEWEKKLTITYPNCEQVNGTPDAVCGPELFDFKWRRRDYTAQMCAYAMPMLERWDRVRVHVLYGAERREDVFYVDAETADRILLPILDRAAKPEAALCDYCGWCAKRLTCPAQLANAKPIATHRDDLPADVAAQFKAWCEAGAHTSQVETPELMAMLLTVARSLKHFIEAAEFNAMEAATKKGWALPGFTLKEKQGRQMVADTKLAYERSGLSPEKFLQACGVRLNTSKKTGLVGLDSLFKETEGTTAAAKRKIQKQLGDVITRGKPILSLVANKGGNETETEE